jgi:hypothetical protein
LQISLSENLTADSKFFLTTKKSLDFQIYICRIHEHNKNSINIKNLKKMNAVILGALVAIVVIVALVLVIHQMERKKIKKQQEDIPVVDIPVVMLHLHYYSPESLTEEEKLSLMAISWDGIQPNQLIIINSLPDDVVCVNDVGVNKRILYFVTEVEENKLIVEDEKNGGYLFPFCGLELEYFSNWEHLSYCVSQYKGKKELLFGLLDENYPSKVIGWEFPTDEEKQKILEEIEEFLQENDGTIGENITLLQRIQASLR